MGLPEHAYWLWSAIPCILEFVLKTGIPKSQSLSHTASCSPKRLDLQNHHQCNCSPETHQTLGFFHIKFCGTLTFFSLLPR